MKDLRLISILLCMSFFASCHEEKEFMPAAPPTIAWDSENSTYIVKIGKTVTISPVYENVENAVYAWKIDGEIKSNDSIFTFAASELGDVYVELDVITDAGSAYAEAKIRTVELEAPIISLATPEDGYRVVTEGVLSLEPMVENEDGATYAWFVDGTKKADTKNFDFISASAGKHTIKLIATNDDGSDEISFKVEVCTPDQMPFKWYFENDVMNISKGRSVRIKIWNVENDFGGTYAWSVNGVEKQKGASTEFVFNSSDAQATGTIDGDFTKCEVVVTMANKYITVSKKINVNICPVEGTYKRTVSGNARWAKVYEYLPAPGQFINEATISNMDEAVAYAEKRLSGEQYLSLGGFGGYMVVGFDHSIENDGSYNIQIKGNSFAGSSEPGIVWVMQDENGDGLPNDTWYELKGSEYGKTDCEIRDYAVTYYRPKAPSMPVQWTDNQGKNGCIDYLASFHRQPYYYPAWVEENTYILTGTCLVGKSRETSPGYWYNGEYDWGYADNYSPIDRLSDDDNSAAGANGNHFKIGDAVTFDGKPADLQYVDFVKIVCGANSKAGWLGEVSTEVFDVYDYNMIKANE